MLDSFTLLLTGLYLAVFDYLFYTNIFYIELFLLYKDRFIFIYQAEEDWFESLFNHSLHF
jgi:hypothetical protein